MEKIFVKNWVGGEKMTNIRYGVVGQSVPGMVVMTVPVDLFSKPAGECLFAGFSFF